MAKTLSALLLSRNSVGVENFAFDNWTYNQKRSSVLAKVCFPYYRIWHIAGEILKKGHSLFGAPTSSRIVCNLKRLLAVTQVNLQ